MSSLLAATASVGELALTHASGSSVGEIKILFITPNSILQ
jgi:hypothetical protein